MIAREKQITNLYCFVSFFAPFVMMFCVPFIIVGLVASGVIFIGMRLSGLDVTVWSGVLEIYLITVLNFLRFARKRIKHLYRY